MPNEEFPVRWSQDDDRVREIYTELRRMAAARMMSEAAGHTLQPTALVHEAWLRLGDCKWQNKAHFFTAAAQAMRRVLVDSARRELTNKRGNRPERVELLDDIPVASGDGDEMILEVSEALDELAGEKPQWAAVVEQHYFGGFGFEQIAENLGVSERTVLRHWDRAKAWLQLRLK